MNRSLNHPVNHSCKYEILNYSDHIFIVFLSNKISKLHSGIRYDICSKLKYHMHQSIKQSNIVICVQYALHKVQMIICRRNIWINTKKNHRWSRPTKRLQYTKRHLYSSTIHISIASTNLEWSASLSWETNIKNSVWNSNYRGVQTDPNRFQYMTPE